MSSSVNLLGPFLPIPVRFSRGFAPEFVREGMCPQRSTSAERESEERAVTPEIRAAYIEVFAMYSARLERLLSKKWKGAYGAVSYAESRKPEHVA